MAVKQEKIKEEKSAMHQTKGRRGNKILNMEWSYQ
jgi:hypothetical protein